MDPKQQSEYIRITTNAQKAMVELSTILNKDLETELFDKLHSQLLESIHPLQDERKQITDKESRLAEELLRILGGTQ